MVGLDRDRVFVVVNDVDAAVAVAPPNEDQKHRAAIAGSAEGGDVVVSFVEVKVPSVVADRSWAGEPNAERPDRVVAIPTCLREADRADDTLDLVEQRFDLAGVEARLVI